ncbi:deleted in malignant brain tumors 1 protein-like [Pomacea canaliculata]|uniref:deleted in malignant brain tumors 1 protein-like n=1 Tax=Pomacea canaliculata TaxID=400727 RepID=UPI000D73AD3C|nr:deleted in malignant brain tumors 1 protein-like [Pomacea canaliculata]
MALRMLALGAAVLLFFQSPTLAFITTRPSDAPFPSTIQKTSVCNNDFYLSAVPGQVGFLTSPNYPSDYYNNSDCRMVIDAGSGYVVKVTVIDVSLEKCCDYLELYDGYRDGSTPPIAKIFSMPSDSVFYSSDQYMDIIFHSDESDTFSGFWLAYEAVDTESEASEPTPPTSDATPVCSADVSLLFAVPGQDGYLSSPNYPRPYYK